MRLFTELSTENQKEYRFGVVELYGFNRWECYYRFITGDTVEIYLLGSYSKPLYIHYKSLVVPQ